MWFPKRQSHILNGALMQLNGELGGAYLVLVFSEDGYRLLPTELCPEYARTASVAEPVPYRAMAQYLQGLINGLEIGKGKGKRPVTDKRKKA